uniref:Putative DNA polymerase epsilon subunit 2 (Trinotate prediction) n=1 Tax=Henneguya salminicola TaxID=69463 RepID=A0A6G3MHP4_HENSL
MKFSRESESLPFNVLLTLLSFPKKFQLFFDIKYVSAALSQAHLCPIPFYSRPLLWHHENCLSIYPLPDLIITAINYPKFVVKEMCTFANPGCYSINQYEYLEYDLKIN